jgi:peptide/nickel transport system substrate-binding protein
MLVRRRGIQIAAGVAVVALALAACSSSGKKKAAASSGPATGTASSSGSAPVGSASAVTSASAAGETKTGNRLTGNLNTINTATVSKGGTLTYALEKTIDNWNVLTSAGDTFETGEVEDSLYPTTFIVQPDLSIVLNTDLLTSADQTSTSPQTIVYKINPKAVWSDGTPITADDFIYEWKAEDGTDCPKCDINSTTGYAQMASVTGSDNGETVTIVFKTPYSDWKSLFTYLMPYHAAVPQGLDPVSIEKSWDTGFAALPTLSAGPFAISDFQKDQSVTLSANPKWYGAKGPYLDKIVYRMITDATQEPPALQNGEVDALYPQPEVDLIPQLNKMSNVVYQLDLGLVWEHIDLNLQNPALQNVAVRKALFTAVDVKGMIARTAGQTDPEIGQLDNRMFVPGQKGFQDNVTSFGYGSGNVAAATALLTAAGYKITGGKLIEPNGTPFPSLLMRYTVGNAVRATECQLFAAAAKQIGITVTVSPTDSLGGTLTQKDANHKYDIIVFAWVASPFGSSNAVIYESDTAQGAAGNWGSNYGHYSNPAVDKLLIDSISTTDTNQENADLNSADKLISADAYTLPLYQKPLVLAYNDKWGNIRDNPTQAGPPINTQEWGLRSAT